MEMEKYMGKNKHITQVLQPINIVSGVSGTSYRQDQGWKDNLSRIAEAHPRSELAKQVGKKSIKQAKTERVLAKHKAKKLGKKFNGYRLPLGTGTDCGGAGLAKTPWL